MADRTAIEWCDATFNPWTGCTKVSPGCDHCYAEGWSKRAGAKVGKWGPGAPRVRTTASNWALPAKWNATPFWQCTGCGWRGDDSDINKASRTCCDAPILHPARRRVFCASLADVFDNEVDAAWQSDLFDLIRATPNLDWLLLTKRIGNAQKLLASGILYEQFPNVWLGATIVNQEEAERDIPKLLATPARVRFLSMEPLLGPVDLAPWIGAGWAGPGGTWCQGLQWVIVGGESGPGARPMHSELVRILRDQCEAAGVPFLFKQWGEYLPGDANADDPIWPEVPESRLFWIDGSKWDRFDGQRAGVSICARVGKKAAGRLLDGVEHNGFPEVACAT